jgi:hypothetical protein
VSTEYRIEFFIQRRGECSCRVANPEQLDDGPGGAGANGRNAIVDRQSPWPVRSDGGAVASPDMSKNQPGIDNERDLSGRGLRCGTSAAGAAAADDPGIGTKRSDVMTETKERPAQWVLELGMRVCGGARPWLPPLVAGTVGLTSWLLLGRLLQSGLWADPKTSSQLDRAVTVLYLAVTCAILLAGIGYKAVAMHAHRMWHTALTDEERCELVTEYSQRLSKLLAALDPRASKLDFTADDLEGLSTTHREELQSLVSAAAAAAQDGFCATVQYESRVLVEAAHIHRELSLHSIVRAETAVPLALVELDDEITTAAKELRASVETGECVCSRPTVDRLIDACVRAREQAEPRREGWN